jgi:hypothetical protein
MLSSSQKGSLIRTFCVENKKKIKIKKKLDIYMQ